MELAEKLAKWAYKLKFNDLTGNAVHETKRRFIDSLATSLGAYRSKPATIARQIVLETPATKEHAVVLGTNRRTTPDLAAFANGAHIRYLDYNDTYLSKEPAHPSDNIAAKTLGETPSEQGGPSDRTGRPRRFHSTPGCGPILSAAAIISAHLGEERFASSGSAIPVR